MDNASKSILALRPVTFYYKSDAKSVPLFGSIAEGADGSRPRIWLCVMKRGAFTPYVMTL